MTPIYSIIHDSIIDNVNMKCPQIVDGSVKNGFYNRIVACSFVRHNCSYQLKGFFKSIDDSLANFTNNLNLSDDLGYIYGSDGVFSMNVDGSLLINIHNFDIYITVAYYTQNGTYTLDVPDFPSYSLTNSLASNNWSILNKRYNLTKNELNITIKGSGGFIIFNDLCIYQVCKTGYQFHDSSEQCEDINECISLSPPCSWSNGICYNTNGSYFCSCNSGWMLGDDKATCVYYFIGDVSVTISNGKGIAIIPKLNKEYLISLEFQINSAGLSINPMSIIQFTNCNSNQDICDTVLKIYTIVDVLWVSTDKAKFSQFIDRSNFLIEISQIFYGNVYNYTIKLNKEIKFSNIYNEAQVFNNIKVYASDPWTDTLYGSIKNLKFVNGISIGGMQPVVIIPAVIDIGSIMIISKIEQQLILYSSYLNGSVNNQQPLGVFWQYTQGYFEGRLYFVLYPLVYYGGFIKFSYVFYTREKVNPSVRYSDSISNFNKYNFESKVSYNDGWFFIETNLDYNTMISNYIPDIAYAERFKRFFPNNIPYYNLLFDSERYKDTMAFLVWVQFFNLPSDLESIYWISCNVSISDLKGCSQGWILNQYKNGCIDINECVNSNPCWNNSLCQNTAGSYLCLCAKGWSLGNDKISCVDNNECITSNPCSWKNSICENTIGSYLCSCTKGWLLGNDKTTCVDYNECIILNSCSWNNSICENTNGSYVCSCTNGWLLGNDNKSCVAIPQDTGNQTPQVTGNETAYIITAAVLVPLVVLSIALLIMLRIRTKKKITELKKTHESFQYIYSNSVEYLSVSANEWKISSKQIFLDEKIGEGAFGNVFIAKINANILAKTKYFNKLGNKSNSRKSVNIEMDVTVAVKILKDGANQSELNDFIEEINLMKGIGYHKNIVNMIGCSTIKKSLCLIVEYMQEGDLLNFLRNKRTKLFMSKDSETAVGFVYTSEYQKVIEENKETPKMSLVEMGSLTPKDLLRFAWQVASGMEYLACMKFVHRDLATRNVLVGADKNLKISDFGLTRKVDLDVYMGGKSRRLPIKWMSIEAIFDRTFTSSSDVWSYGIVLFEIITLGGTPYPTITNSELLPLLKSGYRMDRPGNCSEPMYEIMLHCWKEDPLQRPTFTQLRELFDKILSSGDSYVSLNIDEENSYYNFCSSNSILSGAKEHAVEV